MDQYFRMKVSFEIQEQDSLPVFENQTTNFNFFYTEMIILVFSYKSVLRNPGTGLFTTD